MRATTLLLMTLAVAACGPSEGRPAADEAEVADATTSRWTARTSSGVEVRLEPEPERPGVGVMRFDIALSEAVAEPPTVDLVSPSMPMHGVVRHGTERADDRTYRVEMEIPMGGEWALYVNLDEGFDTAEFLFDVPEVEGGHEHGARPADEGAMTHDHDGAAGTAAPDEDASEDAH